MIPDKESSITPSEVNDQETENLPEIPDVLLRQNSIPIKKGGHEIDRTRNRYLNRKKINEISRHTPNTTEDD